MNQIPFDISFLAKLNGTLAIIIAYSEREWNVTSTQCVVDVYKLLNAVGLSHMRPTYVLVKADPTKEKEFREKTFPTKKAVE